MKLFSFPIIIGIIFALFYPALALDLIQFPFFLLMVLMFIATLTSNINSEEIKKIKYSELFWSIVFIQFLFPFTQAIFSYVLIKDQRFFQGLLAESLTPIALVAPFFTGIIGGNVVFSFVLMAINTLITPIVLPLFLSYFELGHWPINYSTLTKELIILCFLPIFLGLIFKFILRNKIDFIRKFAPSINSLVLAVLIYTLFGAAYLKINFLMIKKIEILMILLICTFQDFGILFLAKKFCGSFFKEEKNFKAFYISASMKNVAIVSSVLLLYDPRSALPAVLCFIPHALLFEYWWWKRREVNV